MGDLATMTRPYPTPSADTLRKAILGCGRGGAITALIAAATGPVEDLDDCYESFQKLLDGIDGAQDRDTYRTGATACLIQLMGLLRETLGLVPDTFSFDPDVLTAELDDCPPLSRQATTYLGWLSETDQVRFSASMIADLLDSDHHTALFEATVALLRLTIARHGTGQRWKTWDVIGQVIAGYISR